MTYIGQKAGQTSHIVQSSENSRRRIMNAFLNVDTYHHQSGNRPVWGGDFNEMLQMTALRIDLVSAVVVRWRFNIHVLDRKVTFFSD